jgi:hypothetical protein
LYANIHGAVQGKQRVTVRERIQGQQALVYAGSTTRSTCRTRALPQEKFMNNLIKIESKHE